MLTLETLVLELGQVLQAMRVQFKKQQLLNKVSAQLVIDDFGVIICAFHSTDYSMLKDFMSRNFSGWRVVYIAVSDFLVEKKDEILWDLMRSGYIRYIRSNYPRQFKSFLLEQDFARKIINNRLKVWKDRPEYKYLIGENKEALGYSVNYLLTVDPAFFDYMPEILDYN